MFWRSHTDEGAAADGYRCPHMATRAVVLQRPQMSTGGQAGAVADFALKTNKVLRRLFSFHVCSATFSGYMQGEPRMCTAPGEHARRALPRPQHAAAIITFMDKGNATCVRAFACWCVFVRAPLCLRARVSIKHMEEGGDDRWMVPSNAATAAEYGRCKTDNTSTRPTTMNSTGGAKLTRTSTSIFGMYGVRRGGGNPYLSGYRFCIFGSRRC